MARRTAQPETLQPETSQTELFPDADLGPKPEGLAFENVPPMPQRKPGQLTTHQGPARQIEGLEGVSVEDLIIPRLKILQAISPELRRGHELYNEINRPGDVIDSSYGTPIASNSEVVCALQKRRWLEWWPRETGRGLRAVHDIEPPEAEELEARRKAGEQDPMTSDGTIISRTHDFYVVLPDSGLHAVISMASTHLRAAKRWLFLAMSNSEPLFTRAYSITTNEITNTKGTWYTWAVRPKGRASDHAIAASIAYREMLLGSQAVTVDYEMPAEGAGHDEDGAM